ncbi:MAG: septum formation initiator family protein [Alphaproteobacteria bacterium]|nr:septum formation initiator family protein [Alphaproteobacteria bacterium]
MNRIFQHRYILRRNLIPIIGMCLCFYFIYHSIQGERGIVRLSVENREFASLSLKHDSLVREREQLEQKVVMLRPGSVDPDFLEERAREVLGYVRPGEITVISN